MTHPELTARSGPWKAVYGGGAYIDVWHSSVDHAVDCINVYDYAEGAPTIPFEQSAVRRELKHWVNEVSQDYLENYIPYA